MFLFLILRHSQAPPLHTKAQLPLRPTLALYLPAGRFPKTRRMLWGHSGAARAKCVRTAVTSSHHRHETLTLLPQRVSEGPKTGTPCPTAQASNPLQPGPSHSPETPAHLSRIEPESAAVSGWPLDARCAAPGDNCAGHCGAEPGPQYPPAVSPGESPPRPARRCWVEAGLGLPRPVVSSLLCHHWLQVGPPLLHGFPGQ